MCGTAARKEHFDIYQEDGTQSGPVLFLCAQIWQKLASTRDELNKSIYFKIEKSVPVMSGYIGIHLTIVLIMHAGNCFTIQNGRICFHLDCAQFPVGDEWI